MNAAFLLMSSVALTGADVTPGAPAGAPVVISSGAGCSNCGAPVVATAAPCGDCGKTKVGLLDKLKSRFGGMGKKSHDCGCAPAPAPAPCDTCGHAAAAPRPNLFDKLKSRMGHKKCDTCGPVCDTCGAAHLMDAAPCATPGAPVTPPTTGTPTTNPPKEMPKPKEAPKDAPKDKPKGDTALPVPPVTGASGLTGAGSPY